MKTTNKIIYAVLPLLAAVLVTGAGCSKAGGSSGDSSSPGGSGQGGSMARFTISGDYLYTVDNSRLKVVSVVNPAAPIELQSQSQDLGWGIETIFTMSDKLFIGSQSAMYIYSIENPQFPTRLSQTTHFKSCDPVAAYDTLAFVTLNIDTGWWCGNTGNVLQAYNIKDVTRPVLISETQVNSPRGLAVDGQAGLIFVCAKGGVSTYRFEATDTAPGIKIEPGYLSAMVPEVENIDAYDCIATDGTLLVIGADGLYQLGYDNEKFSFISKIDLR
jgi:hypothetical protein